MTKKGQAFVGDEISHLMKDGPSKGPQKGKKMPQKQAIAVALDVADRKGFKSAPRKEEAMSIFDSVITKPKSLFDGIVESKKPKSLFDGIVEDNKSPRKSMFDDIVESQDKPAASDWNDRVARTLVLSEELVEIRNRTQQ